MDAEDREDAVVLLRERERATAILDVGADGEDSAHAGARRALDHRVGIVERREVRVRVDHVARPAIHARLRPAIARRAAASSVAPRGGLWALPASLHRLALATPRLGGITGRVTQE